MPTGSRPTEGERVALGQEVGVGEYARLFSRGAGEAEGVTE